jgi:hypothetical protein
MHPMGLMRTGTLHHHRVIIVINRQRRIDPDTTMTTVDGSRASLSPRPHMHRHRHHRQRLLRDHRTQPRSRILVLSRQCWISSPRLGTSTMLTASLPRVNHSRTIPTRVIIQAIRITTVHRPVATIRTVIMNLRPWTMSMILKMKMILNSGCHPSDLPKPL